MPFEIFFQDLPADVTDIGEIAEDFQPAPIGPRAAVVAAIRAALPTLEVVQPGYATMDGAGFSITVSIPEDDPCTGFKLAVRGGEDGAAAAVDAILRVLHAMRDFRTRAICVGGTAAHIFSGDDRNLLVQEFAAFRRYRDQVVGDSLPPGLGL